MNIFICDDEDIYIEQLTDLLTKYFNENKISNVNFYPFSKGEDLLKSEIQPDLAFLDIEIGTGLSGTHVGKKLQERYPNIKIFIVTSHIEYVNEAFRFSFFRYILKPIEKHMLFRNISDAFYQQKVELKEVHIDIKRDKDDRDSSEETITVPVRDVVAITVDNRGTRIFLTNRTVNSNQTISHFDKQLLGSSFFRTHRDFLGEREKNSVNSENLGFL